MELVIKRIDQAEFSSMAGEWNRLLARSASDNFFLRWEWIHTWWSVFHLRRTLCILTATINGHLVGIAPFYIDRPLGSAKARVLHFCSAELSPDYMDLIIDPEHEADVFKAFLDYVRRQKSSDVIVLAGLLKESVVLRHIALMAPAEVRISRSLNCPYVPVEGTYEGYIEHRQKAGKISKKELKWKKENLFKTLGVTHRIVNQESLLPKAIDDLFLLHARRSDAKGIQSNFGSYRVRQFHLQLSYLLLREGLLNIHYLYQDEKPLSVDYTFKYRNKLYCYQKGMDPQWSKLSVGTILQNEIIQQAFAEKLSEVDFLKGEERYKSSWSEAFREQYDLTFYQNTLRGRLLHRLYQGKQWAKSVLKPLL